MVTSKMIFILEYFPAKAAGIFMNVVVCHFQKETQLLKKKF